MKINTIIQFLESVAPLALQEDYDNSGLQIGDKEADVSGVLLSLDCTEAVVDEAIRRNCNLIISHHPVIFGGLKEITGRNYVQRVVTKAIRNNISLYAIHTNLDNVAVGVNKKICEKLGLSSCRILFAKPSSTGGRQTTGSGMIGVLTSPMTETAFLNRVKKVMKAGTVRHTTLLGKKVSKVAVCGGSGSFLLGEAIRQKADVFVTADFKYHQFFDAENKVVIADIGHYESEQFTPDLLRDLLKEKFSIFAGPNDRHKNNPVGRAPRFKKGENKLPLYISGINTNPINYL